MFNQKVIRTAATLRQNTRVHTPVFMPWEEPTREYRTAPTKVGEFAFTHSVIRGVQSFTMQHRSGWRFEHRGRVLPLERLISQAGAAYRRTEKHKANQAAKQAAIQANLARQARHATTDEPDWDSLLG